MLVRFIVDETNDNSEFYKVLAFNMTGEQYKDFLIIRRDNGFFRNRKTMLEYASAKDIIIYTDDETMLNYASYVNGEYQIEFKFPECDEFISIMKLHPNLRRANDLTAMYHKGIFHEDFDLMKKVIKN